MLVLQNVWDHWSHVVFHHMFYWIFKLILWMKLNVLFLKLKNIVCENCPHLGFKCLNAMSMCIHTTHTHTNTPRLYMVYLYLDWHLRNDSNFCNWSCSRWQWWTIVKCCLFLDFYIILWTCFSIIHEIHLLTSTQDLLGIHIINHPGSLYVCSI
jgi:hypothetical protein